MIYDMENVFLILFIIIANLCIISDKWIWNKICITKKKKKKFESIIPTIPIDIPPDSLDTS